MSTVSQLEAVVFSEGGEVAIKTLLNALTITEVELRNTVEEYNNQKRGTVLIIDAKKVLMRVSGEYAGLVEKLRSDVQNTDISKAGLEVLAIVLYCEQGSMTASEVEHIRGVNSGYTLRQLTLRGLLSKVRHGMSYTYTPTAELMSFLGVMHCDTLPERAQIQERLKEYKQSYDTEN